MGVHQLINHSRWLLCLANRHSERVTESRSVCPVCGWSRLSVPPYQDWPGLPVGEGAAPPYEDTFRGASYEVCPSCGFEFGFDDHPGAGDGDSFDEYRARWIAEGCPWWSTSVPMPPGWRGIEQARAAGLLTQSRGCSGEDCLLRRDEAGLFVVAVGLLSGGVTLALATVAAAPSEKAVNTIALLAGVIMFAGFGILARVEWTVGRRARDGRPGPTLRQPASLRRWLYRIESVRAAGRLIAGESTVGGAVATAILVAPLGAALAAAVRLAITAFR